MIKKLIIIIVSFIVVLVSANCTVIGLGIGAAIDGKNPSQGKISCRKIGTIKEGTSAVFHLRDSTTVSGRFLGFSEMEVSDYVLRYNLIRLFDLNEIVLPKIGDTLEVFGKHDYYSKETFQGFDYNFNKDLKIKKKLTDNYDFQYITMILGDESNQQYPYVNNIYRIVDPNENVLVRSQILALTEQGKIPLRSLVVIDGANDKKNIALEKIAYVQSPANINASLILAAAGLLIDLKLLSKIDEFSIGPKN